MSWTPGAKWPSAKASGFSRRRRGKSAKSLELIKAARAILAEIQPASVRAVCYQLFVRKLIPDMSKGSTNRVSTQLTYAREHLMIPWHWIVDEARGVEKRQSWRDPAAYAETVRRAYRLDRWEQQPRRYEVWSEKGTVRGTLAPVLDEYGVAFRVMHGYGSATVLHDVAIESWRSPRPIVALYVGDWDPSGLHMSEVDIPRRLAKYGGRLRFQRLALSAEDVDDPGLPSFPAASKVGDTRHDWYVERYGDACWELDAMDPNDLRSRVEEAIVAGIDPEAWHRCELAEDAQLDSLNDVLTAWKEAAG